MGIQAFLLASIQPAESVLELEIESLPATEVLLCSVIDLRPPWRDKTRKNFIGFILFKFFDHAGILQTSGYTALGVFQLRASEVIGQKKVNQVKGCFVSILNI